MRGFPRLSDTAFAAMIACLERGVPAATRQAVALWRTGRRMPQARFAARIEELTAGAVTVADLRAAREERRAAWTARNG